MKKEEWKQPKLHDDFYRLKQCDDEGKFELESGYVVRTALDFGTGAWLNLEGYAYSQPCAREELFKTKRDALRALKEEAKRHWEEAKHIHATYKQSINGITALIKKEKENG